MNDRDRSDPQTIVALLKVWGGRDLLDLNMEPELLIVHLQHRRPVKAKV